MRKALCLITLLLLMCSGAVFADSHGANAGVADEQALVQPQA